MQPRGELSPFVSLLVVSLSRMKRDTKIRTSLLEEHLLQTCDFVFTAGVRGANFGISEQNKFFGISNRKKKATLS